MSTPPSDEDQSRLQYSLSLLKQQSRLEYSGEYGAEITTFIPFVAWLKQQGHMAGRRIVTYAGMQPYYFFLEEDEFEEKNSARHWLPVRHRYWPSNSTYTATASPWHVYPDYRQHYANSGWKFERPVMYIQNKFTIEWDAGPINYIPLMSLHRLLELTAGRFDVVYSRPIALKSSSSYSNDDNIWCDYPDRALIKEHAHVLDLEMECAASGCDYNRTKLEIMAKARIFVAAQGGGAHVLACFGDSLLLIIDRSEGLSRDGCEYPHAYRDGPYKYLAKTPPAVFVARNFYDFDAAAEMVARAAISGSKIVLPAAARSLLERLSL